MITLGKKYDLIVLDDLGSGCLLDTTTFGLDHEPTVQESVAAGAHLVCFSGDKLLGGPQAGVMVGKKELIYKLKKHPLARAMRIDKIGLAGLIVTLVHYLKGEATSKLPVWRMIATPLDKIERRAEHWAKTLSGIATVISGETMVGGGSLPGAVLPTRLVAISADTPKGQKYSVQLLARRLRQRELPIIGRISGDLLLLDPRTVLPEDDNDVLEALKDAVAFNTALKD
jgi:L-seryl-tRNA(Ser) seleniumtransferase